MTFTQTGFWFLQCRGGGGEWNQAHANWRLYGCPAIYFTFDDLMVIGSTNSENASR